MQYMDKIKKINDIAKDLLRNKITKSADEAVKMAEDILEKEEKGEERGLKELSKEE